MTTTSHPIHVILDVTADDSASAHQLLHRMLDRLPRAGSTAPGITSWWLPVESKCGECGAEAGTDCRPWCTSEPSTTAPAPTYAQIADLICEIGGLEPEEGYEIADAAAARHYCQPATDDDLTERYGEPIDDEDEDE